MVIERSDTMCKFAAKYKLPWKTAQHAVWTIEITSDAQIPAWSFFFSFARAIKFSSGKIQNIPHFWLHTWQKQICSWTKRLCNVLSWELDVFKKLHASHIQNNRTKTPSMSSEINLNQVQASWEEKICSKNKLKQKSFFFS